MGASSDAVFGASGCAFHGFRGSKFMVHGCLFECQVLACLKVMRTVSRDSIRYSSY